MLSTGFAGNTADLLSKLRTFLTSTLPVGQRWVELQYVTTAGNEELIIKSAVTGADELIVGFKHFYSSSSSNSELILQSFSSFSPADFFSQSGGIAPVENMICLPLSTPAIFIPTLLKYWFIADERSIKIVVKVGSYYHQAYLGYILPYANPIEWEKPVCIGGSGLCDYTGTPIRYYETVYNAMTAFWSPFNGSYSGKFGNVSTILIKDSTGSHKRIYHRIGNAYNSSGYGTIPYLETLRNMYGQYNIIYSNSNNFHLMPIQILGDEVIYGEFDGIKYVTGNGINAEDTITISGVQWLCVPNVYILSPNHWAAYRLS